MEVLRSEERFGDARGLQMKNKENEKRLIIYKEKLRNMSWQNLRLMAKLHRDDITMCTGSLGRLI